MTVIEEDNVLMLSNKCLNDHDYQCSARWLCVVHRQQIYRKWRRKLKKNRNLIFIILGASWFLLLVFLTVISLLELDKSFSSGILDQKSLFAPKHQHWARKHSRIPRDISHLSAASVTDEDPRNLPLPASCGLSLAPPVGMEGVVSPEYERLATHILISPGHFVEPSTSSNIPEEMCNFKFETEDSFFLSIPAMFHSFLMQNPHLASSHIKEHNPLCHNTQLSPIGAIQLMKLHKYLSNVYNLTSSTKDLYVHSHTAATQSAAIFLFSQTHHQTMITSQNIGSPTYAHGMQQFAEGYCLNTYSNCKCLYDKLKLADLLNSSDPLADFENSHSRMKNADAEQLKNLADAYHQRFATCSLLKEELRSEQDFEFLENSTKIFESFYEKVSINDNLKRISERVGYPLMLHIVQDLLFLTNQTVPVQATPNATEDLLPVQERKKNQRNKTKGREKVIRSTKKSVYSKKENFKEMNSGGKIRKMLTKRSLRISEVDAEKVTLYFVDEMFLLHFLSVLQYHDGLPLLKPSSRIVIEMYRKPTSKTSLSMNHQVERNVKVISPLQEMYIRVLFNGKDISKLVPLCSRKKYLNSESLCPLKYFLDYHRIYFHNNYAEAAATCTKDTLT